MSQHCNNTTNGDNNGVGNLLALAHIATMTEEIKSSATEKSAEKSPPMPMQRRPAKKRAVPAEFTNDNVNSNTTTTAHHSSSSTFTQLSSSLNKRPQKTNNNTFRMKANQPSFPVVLMAILSATQNRQYITFLSNGGSFIIIDPVRLELNVLPKHFEDKNSPTYDEFLQLLAIWGFKVIKDPQYPHVSVYQHPLFKRGDWKNCLRMKLNVNGFGDEANQALPQRNADDPSPSNSSRSVTPPVSEEKKKFIPKVLHCPKSSIRDKQGQSAITSFVTNRRATVLGCVPPASYQAAPLLHQANMPSRNYRRATVDSMYNARSMFPYAAAGLQHGRLQHGQPQFRHPAFLDRGRMNTTVAKPVPSDAEVLSATQNVVYAAIDVLRGPKSRRITIEHQSLDFMTEKLLGRSFARRNITLQPQVEPLMIETLKADLAKTKAALLSAQSMPPAA